MLKNILLAVAIMLAVQPAYAGPSYKTFDLPDGISLHAGDGVPVSRAGTGSYHLTGSEIINSVYAAAPGTSGQIAFNSGGSLTTADAETLRGLLGLAPVAATGAYTDLTGTPTIPTNNNQITNGAGYITASGAPVQTVNGQTGAVTLSIPSVGTSGATVGLLNANLTFSGAVNFTSTTTLAGQPIVTPATATAYTAQQNFAAASLTDGSSIPWNLNTAQSAYVTLAGNRTLSNPTNMVAGGTYVLRVTQDGTGNRTLAYDTAYKWPGGTPPDLSTGAGKVDLLTFISDGTNMFGTYALDMR